jgi:hypothetical protein
VTHTLTKHCCDFCNREYKVEANAIKHQWDCYRDTANRACVTCKHFREYDSDEEGPYSFACIVGAMPVEMGRHQLTHHCEQHEIAENIT